MNIRYPIYEGVYRILTLYKRVAAKRKYKWASGLYKNFNYEDKKGIAPACLPREKETG